MSKEVKEHKDDPLRDVEESVDSEELQGKAEKHLRKFKGLLENVDEPVEPEPESVDSNPEEQPAEEPEEDPEPNPDEVDEDEEPEDGSKDKEDPPEADDIPEGHIRAAKGQGWTDEDIAAEIEADPDRARRLFQNAYETSNKVTRQFAAIGRDKADATRKAAEKSEPEIKDFITAEELAKVADEDQATATVLKAMNDRIKAQDIENVKLRKSLPIGDVQFAKSDQQVATARANATAEANSLQTVNQFFNADNMEAYTDFYGVVKSGQDWNDITPRQYDHRMEVLQIADQLKVGKASQGIEIPDTEALESAHLLATDSMRETNTVDKIKKSLKKRTKTLRPSASKRLAKSTGIKKATNRDEAVANAGARLAALKQKGW